MAGPTSPIARAFLKLVGAIVALDAAAIGIFELGHVRLRGSTFLQRYVIVWTVASALVAAWGVGRVRRARRGAAGRDGPSGSLRDD